jgi:hypothetical protein
VRDDVGEVATHPEPPRIALLGGLRGNHHGRTGLPPQSQSSMVTDDVIPFVRATVCVWVAMMPDGPRGGVEISNLPTSERATASSVVDGQRMEALCTVAADRNTEQCRFQVGSRHLTSLDHWNGSGWDGRYDDGSRIDIQTAEPMPVPIPVGRPALH